MECIYCGEYGRRADGTSDDYFFVAYNDKKLDCVKEFVIWKQQLRLATREHSWPWTYSITA